MAEPKVSSLAKALHVLECFTVDEPELGITEISAKLGIGKSNAHNIISTYCQMGYLQQMPNRKYALGYKLLEHAFIINQHLGYPRAVYDLLLETAERTDQIVYFGIPYGTDVLYPVCGTSDSTDEGASVQGDTRREIAAVYNEHRQGNACKYAGGRVAGALTKELKKYTENTITDPYEIILELRRTRQRGYAIDERSNEYNVRCVGVPVYNSAGQLIAGMSTSGPAQVMTDAKLMENAEILQSAALRMRDRFYR